jgi:Holliday junction resolvasome RuvABC endonuclease subunit
MPVKTRRKQIPASYYSRPELDDPFNRTCWYIGLDQSSTDNGIAAYHKDTNTIYTTYFFCGKHDIELVERLYRLERFLESAISALNPKRVYTEEVHPGNRHAYAVLLRVEMAIHSMLYRHYVPYSSISANVIQHDSWPAQLKLKGTKEHIRLALTNVADPTSTEHELDAVGVLLGGLTRDGLFELELINKLKINRVEEANEFVSILGFAPS